MLFAVNFLGLKTAGATAADYATWTNGDAVTVTDWMTNQPSSANEECVAMDSEDEFHWNDILCNAPAAYICKTDPVCPTGVSDCNMWMIKNFNSLHWSISADCSSQIIIHYYMTISNA